MKFVSENLINLEDKNNLKKLAKNKKPEVYVDFSKNPYGELKININFNKTLSETRKELSQNTSFNNILFLFFDHISRVHFYRQYKKTIRFLKKFLSFEGFSTKNNHNNKYHGFEFLKYHKFKKSTLFNIIPMFCGVYFNRTSRMISIIKDMK